MQEVLMDTRMNQLLSRQRRHMILDPLFVAAMVLATLLAIAPIY
jgi:hypothetical protein